MYFVCFNLEVLLVTVDQPELPVRLVLQAVEPMKLLPILTVTVKDLSVSTSDYTLYRVPVLYCTGILLSEVMHSTGT